MWQDILNQVIPALIPLVSVIITGVVSFLTYKINKYIQQLKDKSESEMTKHIIETVVAYVDQCLEDASNEEKFKEAAKKASEWLASKGIVISEIELQILIEAAVNAAHQGKLKELPIVEHETIIEEKGE